jgi:hypothetical protein
MGGMTLMERVTRAGKVAAKRHNDRPNRSPFLDRASQKRILPGHLVDQPAWVLSREDPRTSMDRPGWDGCERRCPPTSRPSCRIRQGAGRNPERSCVGPRAGAAPRFRPRLVHRSFVTAGRKDEAACGVQDVVEAHPASRQAEAEAEAEGDAQQHLVAEYPTQSGYDLADLAQRDACSRGDRTLGIGGSGWFGTFCMGGGSSPSRPRITVFHHRPGRLNDQNCSNCGDDP